MTGNKGDLLARLKKRDKDCRDAAAEIERLNSMIRAHDAGVWLEEHGIAAQSAIVDLSKETMGKLIACEKLVAERDAEIERLRGEVADLSGANLDWQKRWNESVGKMREIFEERRAADRAAADRMADAIEAVMWVG